MHRCGAARMAEGRNGEDDAYEIFLYELEQSGDA